MPATANNNTTYTLSAVAAGDMEQAQDLDCQCLTLNNLDQKRAFRNTGCTTPSNNESACWNE